MKSYTKSNQNATPKIRALPPSHIRVDGRETLRRHVEAFEQFKRDEQARMDRTGRRAA